jgi:hypothetical protein
LRYASLAVIARLAVATGVTIIRRLPVVTRLAISGCSRKMAWPPITVLLPGITRPAIVPRRPVFGGPAVALMLAVILGPGVALALAVVAVGLAVFPGCAVARSLRVGIP